MILIIEAKLNLKNKNVIINGDFYSIIWNHFRSQFHTRGGSAKASTALWENINIESKLCYTNISGHAKSKFLKAEQNFELNFLENKPRIKYNLLSFGFEKSLLDLL